MATIPEALALAFEHHQAGRLAEAEQIYRQVLQAEPNQVDALHLLGVLARQVGKHEIALQYIGRAIALHANVASFHRSMGETYCALSRFTETVACYRRALELQPDDAEVHNNLGAVLKGLGDVDGAVACFRRAGAETGLCRGLLQSGAAVHQHGSRDEAAACYRRALELNANYAEVHNNLGLLLEEEGNWKRRPPATAGHSNWRQPLPKRTTTWAMSF